MNTLLLEASSRLIDSVLKPGPARRADPGLGPVRVEAKTRSRVGPVKPGRPGRSTRDPADPGLEPVRVEAKTRSRVSPVKPG